MGNVLTFWAATALLALGVTALLLLTLMRTRAGATPAAAYDLQVYRDQLRDVDRDLARGVIAAAEAERIRTEISRRILAADAEMQVLRGERGGSGRATRAVAVLLVLGVIGGSLALYRALGAPGYGDLSLQHRIEMAEAARANRPGQAAAEAELPPQPPLGAPEPRYLALMDRLRATVAERPDDLQGHILLARNEAALGNFAAAHAAQAEVLRIKGERAEAADYADYADMLILAAGGYVSPEAEAALRAALEREPGNGAAQYYMGLMMSQTGRPDLAFRIWERLLLQSPPDAPWLPPIRAQIEEVARRAGTEARLPRLAPQRGPTAADIEAAGDMTAEERMEMIRGMVQGLSDRLASDGGPPEDWARLIGALGVLGEREQAGAIYENARAAFAGNDAALAMIAQAARRAGLLE